MKDFLNMEKVHREGSAFSLSRRSFLGKTIGLSALYLSADFWGWVNTLPFAYGRTRESFTVESPQAVAVAPSGTIYATSITEGGSYRVVGLDLRGKIIHAFGKAGSAPGDLNFPQGLAIDNNGEIYVVERNNGRISVFDSQGKFKRFIGSLGLIYGRTYSPEGICLHDDTIFLADTRNHRIQIFDKHGEVLLVIGEMGDRDDQFRLPTSLEVTKDGLLYVVDSKHNYIKVISLEGKFIKKFGGTSTKEKEKGSFNHPSGISLDEKRDRVYVSDTMNDRIQVFNLEGKFVEVVDEAKGYSFNRPKGISLDSEGNLLIADTNNNQIQIIFKDEIS
jgi:DNA-binding beta-propeller fold protein YncE